MRKVDWQGKLIDKESCLTRKIDWWGKLLDKESLWWYLNLNWSLNTIWQGKLLHEESWLTRRVAWEGEGMIWYLNPNPNPNLNLFYTLTAYPKWMKYKIHVRRCRTTGPSKIEKKPITPSLQLSSLKQQVIK